MNIEEILKKTYPQREKDTKKYDGGLVLVIGGSEIYSGSPALCAMAALRGGADIVQIASVKRAADIIASFSPSFITFPFEGKNFDQSHLSRLLEITHSARIVSRGNLSVIIGGGIGRKEETKNLVREYIKNTDVPTVVDADGIYAFEDNVDFIERDNLVFTPHLYEFKVLTKTNLDNFSLEQKIEEVKKQASLLGVTIVLKGSTDIISDGVNLYLNEVAVPEMATGGCGDTLAGLIGAALCKNKNIFESAGLGTYINSRAGELASKEKGNSLIASDLIDKISEIIKN